MTGNKRSSFSFHFSIFVCFLALNNLLQKKKLRPRRNISSTPLYQPCMDSLYNWMRLSYSFFTQTLPVARCRPYCSGKSWNKLIWPSSNGSKFLVSILKCRPWYPLFENTHLSKHMRFHILTIFTLHFQHSKKVMCLVFTLTPLLWAFSYYVLTSFLT